MDRVPSNHRLAERMLIRLVEIGEWEIDDQGRIWRTKVRHGLPMSRRRTSFQPADGVTADELYTACYGEQARRKPRPLHRGQKNAPVSSVDALIWQVTVRVLTSEAASVVGAVLVTVVLARLIGGVQW